MYEHQDVLDELNFNAPLRAKLRRIHAVLNTRVPMLDRISIALYDRKTDLLKTLADSSEADKPLQHYQAHLRDTPSLYEIVTHGRPRLVRDLVVFQPRGHEHTRRLLLGGYHASYALPVYNNGAFVGFIFFNSRSSDAFAQNELEELDIFGHLIAFLVIDEIGAIEMLLGALKTARALADCEEETDMRLERVSRYTRLIGQELAEKYGFDDDYIEHLSLFASLHDMGAASQEQAPKGHIERGRDIVATIARNFGLDSFGHIDVLRNIAESHHEKANRAGERHYRRDIPIEARIVACAEVFDALTRDGVAPWANDDAFAALDRMAGVTLDPDCVTALERRRVDIEEIEARFRERQA